MKAVSRLLASLIWLAMSQLSFAAAATQRPVDATTGLVIQPGWEQVRAHCGACHSYALVTNQRAGRQTWLDIIRWMQATQNLWQLPPVVESQILDYLASSYPPQPNRRRVPIPLSLLPKIVAAERRVDKH